MYCPASTWLNGGGCFLTKTRSPTLLSETGEGCTGYLYKGANKKDTEIFKRWAAACVVMLLLDGVAVRDMGEPEATLGKNRLHASIFRWI